MRRPALLRMLPVFGASMFACGMGLFWAIAKLSMPQTPAALGDPGAYITTALLGIAVLMSLGFQERRICELEERLGAQERPAPPVAAPDHAGD